MNAGITSYENPDIQKAYPNPFKDFTTIYLNRELKDAGLSVLILHRAYIITVSQKIIIRSLPES